MEGASDTGWIDGEQSKATPSDREGTTCSPISDCGTSSVLSCLDQSKMTLVVSALDLCYYTDIRVLSYI